jgi:hypothetical protein
MLDIDDSDDDEIDLIQTENMQNVPSYEDNELKEAD